MANKKEADSTYFLKLVFYLIVGAFWLKLIKGGGMQIPLPLGFLAGLAFTRHERLQIDRKIEYAILLVAMFVGFWMPFGLYISL
jgi:hypothetical protein